MMDSREHPGVRLLYRLRGDKEMVYHTRGMLGAGAIDDEDVQITQADQYSEENALVDNDVISLLQQADIKCPVCKGRMTVYVKGTHLARRLIVKCTTGGCIYNNPPEPETIGKTRIYVANVAATYLSMLMDQGIKGVQHMCWATHMKPFDAKTY